MYSARNNSQIAFRLVKGEDVHASLINLATEYEISGGFVCSGIGMLENPEIGYFVSKGHYERRLFEGCFELLNISGNLSSFEGSTMAHLHVMLANEDYSVFGGHLFVASVGLTLEGYLQVADPVRMYRTVEEDTGLPGLLID